LLLEAHPPVDAQGQSLEPELEQFSQLLQAAVGDTTVAIHWDYAREVLQKADGVIATVGLEADNPDAPEAPGSATQSVTTADGATAVGATAAPATTATGATAAPATTATGATMPVSDTDAATPAPAAADTPPQPPNPPGPIELPTRVIPAATAAAAAPPAAAPSPPAATAANPPGTETHSP
jgi:hypothetical protein